MKVVIDTNVLISSLRRTATNRPIFNAIIRGAVTLAVTNQILLEYTEIVGQRATPDISRNVIQLLLQLPGTERVDIAFRFNLISVDPDDNKFVDCAVASNADFIVTNDKHFNGLKAIDFPKVAVINAKEFLEVLDTVG